MTFRRRALALGLVICTSGLACAFSRSDTTESLPAAVSADERARTLVGLAPPKRARPLVAVLGANAGTETTDFLIPYAVLRESDVADVVAVTTQPGPLTLIPALTVQGQLTTRELDALHPEGADYVIVPAMHDPDDPAVLAWVESQRSRGAFIVGVCSGARILSRAGLLRDRDATGHWSDVSTLRAENPSMRWVRDRRYVVDRGVVTTTGVSASIPLSLALVEAIGGRSRAETVARALGIARWDAEHDSSAFELGGRHLWTALRNTLAFWSHEDVRVRVEPGVDELALALTADAYSRTFRSRALTFSRDVAPVPTRRGLQLIPDRALQLAPPVTSFTALPHLPGHALETALEGIAERYGEDTAAFVALQLEYLREVR